MAITWSIRTELINSDTGLRKVFAIRTDDTDPNNLVIHSFQIKARMKTTEEKKAVWDSLHQQYLDSVAIVSDSIADEGKTYLELKEVS